MSIPMPFLFNNLASTKVVPLPRNWSRTQSPTSEYLRIIFLGIYGVQFPLYFELWVAQSPLCGKLQIVVASISKLVGSQYVILLLLSDMYGVFSSLTAEIPS